MRKGHSPIWPKFRPDTYKYKNLLLMDFNGKVYDKFGKKKYSYDGYENLLNFLHNNDAMLFVRDFSYCNDMLMFSISNKHAKVSCRKNGVPTGITVRGKQSSKIILSTAWNVPNKNVPFDVNFLKIMNDTYKHCKVGTCGTPGSLGKALQYNIWKTENLGKHTSPSLLAQKYIRENAIGGRCDTLKSGYIGDAIELDGSSFWLGHCFPLCTGTAIPFTDGCIEGFYTFFAQCTVTIKNELALGPFPLRRKDGKIVYPTLPGTYKTYLWREQCDDAIEQGCNVVVDSGYGWLESTYDMEYYARHAYALRMLVYGSPIEDNIKQSIVGGFGYWAMSGDFYSLTDTPSEDDRWYPSLEGPTDIFIHKEPYDYNNPNMPHWYYYLITNANRTLFQFSLPYAKEGRLIATNYDAVYVLEKDESKMYARKYSPQAAMCKVAEWRWSRLHDLIVLGDRSYDGYIEMPTGDLKRKLVTPGVSHE